MTRERLIESDQYEVDQRQQCEGCHEHIVVDQRGVASKGHGNDVADEGHDNDHEEELQEDHGQSLLELDRAQNNAGRACLCPSQDEVEWPGHHFDGLIEACSS